jgi:hypothetical protein
LQFVLFFLVLPQQQLSLATIAAGAMAPVPAVLAVLVVPAAKVD